MSIPSRSKPTLVVLALFAAACSKSSAQEATDIGTAQAAEVPAEAAAAPASGGSAGLDASKIFEARCSVCHGERGKGDGPGAAALNPKPRDYTDVAWQGSVTDEQIRNVILMGGAAIGKSPIMPSSPDLQSKPEVVDELVKIVRGFKGG